MADCRSVSAELRCSQRSFAIAWLLGLHRRKFVSARRLGARDMVEKRRRRIEVSEWDCGERREVVVVGRAISGGGRMGHNLSPPPKLGGDSRWAVTITPRPPPKIVPKKKI